MSRYCKSCKLMLNFRAMKYNDEGIEMPIPGSSNTSGNLLRHQTSNVAVQDGDNNDSADDNDNDNELKPNSISKLLEKQDKLCKELTSGFLRQLREYAISLFLSVYMLLYSRRSFSRPEKIKILSMGFLA